MRAIAATATVSDVDRSWWLRLAPGVAAVEEFTDGDETRYLPAQLGAALLRFDPLLGVEYVRELVAGDRRDGFDSIMYQIVDYGYLVKPARNSLFSTCIDANLIRKLEPLARNGDDLAEEIFRYLADISSEPSDGGASAAAINQQARNLPPANGETVYQDLYLDYPPEKLEHFFRTNSSSIALRAR